VRAGDLDAVEHLHEPALAGIAPAPAGGIRVRGADVILAHEEDLDREIGMGEERGEGHELAEDVDRARPPRRAPGRDDLAVLVGADDPALGGDRVDDADAMPVEQGVELATQGAKSPRLHLDELAVGTHEIDHEAGYRYLQAVAGLGQQSLHRGMQRPFAHDPDARHGRQARPRRGRLTERRFGKLGAVVDRLIRMLLRPIGYLAFVVALAALSVTARVLGERDDLGFFSARLAKTLWAYPEVTRRGVQTAWLVWAALFVVAVTPIDPIATPWDQVALGAGALAVLWRRFFGAHRVGR